MDQPRAVTDARGMPSWMAVVLFLTVYYVSARLGLLFAGPPAYVAAVWPPAGVALVGALFLGRLAFPVIWTTTLLGSPFWTWSTPEASGVAVALALFTTTGSTLRATLGARLLRHFGGSPLSLSRVRTVVSLVLGAGVAASTLSATVGVGARYEAGLLARADVSSTWLTWWLADIAGVVIVAPLILAFREGPRLPPRPHVRREGLLLAAATTVVVSTVLTGFLEVAVSRPLAALLLPLLMWPAFRFGPAATSLTAVILGTVAVWGSAHGVGPFSGGNPVADLMLGQIFVMVHAATGLTLAAAVEERRETDRRLRETTALLASVTEGTPDIVFVKDLAGRYLMINQAGARYLGRTVAEVVGRKDDELFGPDMARQIREFDRLVLETGRIRTDEYLDVVNGAPRTFLATKGPIRDAEGRVSGLFGISRDVTDRKIERSVLKGILEGTPDLVGAVDRDFRFVAFNPALKESYRRRFGTELQEGMRMADAVADDPEALARHLDLLGRALRGEELRVTWAIGAEGQEPRFYDVAASPLRDETGHVIGSAAIARDVTPSRQAEEDLRQASVALEAANEELESFSYSVSHDLRTPLRGIDGFSRALEEDFAEDLPEEAKTYITRIRKATKRMGQIIDDLLTLSRVARSELRRDRVDLSALASEVDATLRAAEPERQVDFHPEPGLRADGDVRLLRLLFENLLGNAWKYTSRRPRARIEFGSRDGNGERAYFVRDDGAGFEMAYADKLFGVFQRLHSTSEFPGSGIGLATVARIVHRHGGRVWAEGRPGEGATFYFTLGKGANA